MLTIDQRGAPYMHHPVSSRTVMLDAILPLGIIYMMAVYHYGPKAVYLGLAGVAAALLADWLGILLSGRRPHIRDLSPVVTGMILALLMPVSVPLYIPVIAACFGILVAKHPFGGLGQNIFNPAAAGFAFVAICFPDLLFSYPSPVAGGYFAGGAAAADLEQILVNGPAFTLNLGGIPSYDYVDLLLGNFPGPMGATNILVILACLLYLIFRGTVRWQTPVFYLITTAAIAYLAPRAPVTGLESVLFELTSGFLLFGGVFMLGDPVTSPMRSWSRVVHAVLAGVVVMLFRHAGNLEEGFIYALLVLNASVWGLDQAGERMAGIIRRKRFAVIETKEVQTKA